MVCRRRVSFCRPAATLLALATLAALPAHAAVTTYTSTFSGTIAAGDTALLTGTASVSGNVANSGTLQFNITGSSAVANNAIISGTGLVRMTGSGTVTNLFDAQTYTGATRLENGTLLINYNDRLGNTSSGVTFDGGRLQITNSGVLSTFSTARSMSLLSAGTIDTSTLADGSYDQPAFTGVVSGTGTLTLAAHGLGNGASDAYLRFGGASTYTGTTRITSGMVYASSTTAFGSSTVVLDGGGLVAPNAVTINNAIVLAGTASAFRPWTGDTVNLGGVISGTGGLQKTDNGTVILTAANTYSGATTITGGTLQIGGGGTTGEIGGEGMIANSGVLAINRANDFSLSRGITGSGGFRQIGTGTTTLSGTNTYAGGTVVSAGRLVGTTSSLQGAITNNATVVFDQTTDGTYSGSISGGRLVKTGSGAVTLTGSNTCSTELQAGALTLGSANAIGSSGTISFTGGTLQYSASNTTDYSARFSTAAGQDYSIDTNGQNVTFANPLNSSGGSLTKLGAGVLNLTGTEVAQNLVVLVLDFTTNVSAGRLQGAGGSGILFIGHSGTGTLNVTGGSVTNTRCYLGEKAGSVGTATVSSGTWANSSDLIVGYRGTGTLNVTGGSVTNTFSYLGYNAGSAGSATVSSGTWANSGSLFVGHYSGPGTLNVTGGIVTNTNGSLGYNVGSVGTATVSSGTWANSGNLTVGSSGTATLTMSGGLVTVGGTLSRGANGTINLNAGGTLQIGTGGTTGVLATNLTNDGTLVFNRSNNSTYSGTIGGNGSVTKQGAGTLTLAGANTYTGLTWVREGTLAMGVSNAFAAASDLTLDSGATFDRAGFSQSVTDAVINGSVANTGGGGLLSVTGTLSGSGILNGNVTVTGIHAPGNSPGAQTFAGDLTYTAGAAVNWELVANTTGSAGTLFDQIVLPTGNLAFSGSTSLNLTFNAAGSTVDWSNPFWAVDRSWLVYDLSAGTTTGIGSFAVAPADWLDANAATLSSARPGSTFSVGLTGQDVVLNYVAAVPEPTSLAVLAAGAVIGLGLRRKRDRGSDTIGSPR